MVAMIYCVFCIAEYIRSKRNIRYKNILKQIQIAQAKIIKNQITIFANQAKIIVSFANSRSGLGVERLCVIIC